MVLRRAVCATLCPVSQRIEGTTRIMVLLFQHWPTVKRVVVTPRDGKSFVTNCQFCKYSPKRGKPVTRSTELRSVAGWAGGRVYPGWVGSGYTRRGTILHIPPRVYQEGYHPAYTLPRVYQEGYLAIHTLGYTRRDT